jgi:DNA-binding transcriptional LysR family regulator
MNLSEVDLNLFLVLQTVLEEGNATRAAARLHVTQSAVSNALARARRVFADPLVVRAARGLVPTPRALELTPQLGAALDLLRALLASEAGFEPSRSSRRFTVACSDAVEFVMMPRLSSLLERSMPNASLRVVTIDHMLATNGLSTGEVDLLVGIPPSIPAGCTGEIVYEDTMVCIVRRGHPTIRSSSLTLEAYADVAHVEVALFGVPDSRVDAALARQQRARRIAISVPHFITVPTIVARTNAVATLARRLALVLAPARTLRTLRLPIELPVLRVQQVWHARAAGDPGTLHLRKLVRQAVRA